MDAATRMLIAGIDGWLSEAEVAFLFETARRCSGRGVIVEVGSFMGKSTVTLAEGSKAGARRKVCAIDPHLAGGLEQKLWLGGTSSWQGFLTNLKAAKVGDIVRPVRATSAEAGQRWEEAVEFLWIDGDHRYEAALRDFETFAPFVVPGGVVAFHDSTDGGDVSRVVQEVFGREEFSQLRLVDSITAAVMNGGRKSWRDRGILVLHRNYRRFARFVVLRGLKRGLKRIIASLQ